MFYHISSASEVTSLLLIVRTTTRWLSSSTVLRMACSAQLRPRHHELRERILKAFWTHWTLQNAEKYSKMWSKITEPVVLGWMQKDWESLSDRTSHWVGSCWTHESWANRLPQRLGGRLGQLRFRQMTLDGTYGIPMNSIDIQQVPTYSNM